MTDLTIYQPPPQPLIPFNDIQQMARAVAQSGLFGIKTEPEAIALMLFAQAENLHPMIAVRDYHIINKKPSMKADTMLARFQSSGGRVEWEKYDDAIVVGVFSHPSSSRPVRVEWTFERASNITVEGWDNTPGAAKGSKITTPLTDKDVWRHYPRAMLRARCISEGIRTVYPGVLCGLYTPEEIESIPSNNRNEIDITPQPVATITPPPATTITADELAELEAAIKAMNLNRALVLAWAVKASKNTITEFHELTPLMLDKLSAMLGKMAESPHMLNQPQPEQEAA